MTAQITGRVGGHVCHANFLAGMAAPATTVRLPQRAAVDAYCTECGRTGSHWAGCSGSHTRSSATGRLSSSGVTKTSAPRAAQTAGVLTEEVEVPR